MFTTKDKGFLFTRCRLRFMNGSTLSSSETPSLLSSLAAAQNLNLSFLKKSSKLIIIIFQTIVFIFKKVYGL